MTTDHNALGRIPPYVPNNTENAPIAPPPTSEAKVRILFDWSHPIELEVGLNDAIKIAQMCEPYAVPTLTKIRDVLK